MKFAYVCSPFYNGDPRMGASYEVSQIGGTLEDLSLKVEYIDSRAPNVESRIQRAAKDHDVLLYTPIAYEIDPSVWSQIDIPKIFLFPDDEWRRPFSLELATDADYVMSTARDGAAAFGDKYIPFQWGARLKLYTRQESTIPISFFGQKYGYREEVVKFIEKLGLPVKAYGAGWGESITDSQIATLITQSKMSLTTSMASQVNIRQIKARNFEIPAGGALLMAEYAPGIEDYYVEDKEAVFWRSPQELADKLYFYLSDERARWKVAQAGYMRTVKDHDYRKRFVPMLERLGILVRNQTT